jgi:hypothetical protein
METKRCTYCQKIALAQAEFCRGCGRPFARTPDGRLTPIPSIIELPTMTSNTRKRARPVARRLLAHGAIERMERSIPPASPHHAGHYAGLHPEDQPYQSTFIPVQVRDAVAEPVRGDAAGAEKVAPAFSEESVRVTADLPTLVIPPRQSRPRWFFLPEPITRLGRKQFVSIGLVIACLLLLISGSSLAYAFINKAPAANTLILTAQPNQLRVKDTLTLSGQGFGANDLIYFIHDGNQPILNGNGRQLSARADAAGTFSVQMAVPTTWNVGQHSIYAIDIDRNQSLSIVSTVTIEQSSLAPPMLALPTSHLNLSAAAPGIISKQTITLANLGGRTLSWQASSDQPWLSIFPNNGTFSGKSIVAITVNRGILPPQHYSGHITFIQQGGDAQPLTLTVTMSVQLAPPANLTVSTASLTYQATEAQNPAAQTLTLQNGSDQGVDWSSAIITGDGAGWLSISPGQDHLAAHSSETITVMVQSQQLAVGSYIGFIAFKGGTNPVVPVALSIVAPGNLVASPPSLTFSAIGQNPPAQTITIQNSGGATLNWSVSASTVDGANWLLATPKSGSLNPGASANIAISINATTLTPRSYQGTLTFAYNGLTKTVPVALSVSVPPAAVISVSQNALNFSTILGSNPAAQTLTLTNSGNAVLNWTASEAQNGASFAPVSPTSGSLNPTQSVTITIAPNVIQQSAGTLSTTLTIADSDSGTKVASQQVAVTIAIKDQAQIALSQSSMTYSQAAAIPTSTQLLIINNTGSQPLNWTVQSSAAWLTADVSSGTIVPGGNALLNVQADSTGLTPGTYTATLQVSDSDANTPVASQSVTVTMTVS